MGWFDTGIGRTIKDTGKFVASFIPGVGDKIAQDDANKENIKQAEINRRFQERMSSTAYQRAMGDMYRSGLNPMLAINQGGASAPSGSQAQVVASSRTGLFDAALKATTGIGSLHQKATALQQQSTMNESSIKLNAATAAKNLQEAEKTRLNNVRNKKYEGIDTAGGRLGDKVGKGLDSIMNMIDSSSGKDSKVWNDALKAQSNAAKKARENFDKKNHKGW